MAFNVFTLFLHHQNHRLKRYAAILFLLLFSLRPGYYVGQLMYYELNIDYIIETYCINKEKPQMQCNGKCHLAKQLQIAEPSGKDQAISIVFEAFFPVFVQDTPSFEFNSITTDIPHKATFFYSDAYTFEWDDTLYRPPII